MEFDAIPEFCHSEAQIVQGGFVTGMLDASMAHLVIILEEFQSTILFHWTSMLALLDRLIQVY